jgi:thiamine biosynthesis lipoprotein
VCATEEPPGRLVRLSAGGLATSSIRCRQWRRGGRTLHHIVDPRTGLPAAGTWRTASVAAASCAEANAAATAAIVAGEQAAGWLAAQGLPARLVAHDGSVRLLGGWPATVGGLVKVPATPRMPAAPSGRPDGMRRPPEDLSEPARPDRVR